MKLKVQPLSAQAFAPFGHIVTQPNTPSGAGLGFLDFWPDLAPLPDTGGPYGVGYITVEPRPLVQSCAERHMHTAECLVPVGGDMLVVVGPPEHLDRPDMLPPPQDFAAFRVAEGEAVILHPGVWHWAPFAAEGPIRGFVIYKAGTSESDVVFREFAPEATLEIEI
jgi:ureidoglycolate lyase